jgi:peptidyl-prolyl cis-trans isomerase C
LTARGPDCYPLAHVKNFSALALLALLVSVAAGCRDEPGAPPAGNTSAQPSKAESTSTRSAPNEDRDGPIATVNGQPVSRARFRRELAQSRARYEKARKEVQPELLDNLRQALVRRLVESEVVRQKAIEWGIAPSDEELETMWTKHRERFGTDDAFRAFLERAGTTEADLKNQFVDNLLLDRVKQRIAERLEIREDELRDYYETRPQHFEEPEEVRVAQILVQVPAGATTAEAKAARDRAMEALESIRDGADFAAVASRVSDGPARMRGGDLGYLPRGRLVPEVEQTAFSLKPGQLSDLIESRFGYHIIRVVDHRPERTLSFDEARPRIERRLRGQLLRKAIHEQIESWKREMDIELHEDTELFTRSPSRREPAGPQALSEEGVQKLKSKDGEDMEPVDLKTFPKGFSPAREMEAPTE